MARKAEFMRPIRQGRKCFPGVEEQGMYALGFLRNLGYPVVSALKRYLRTKETK
jgi:hypothetical protein